MIIIVNISMILLFLLFIIAGLINNVGKIVAVFLVILSLIITGINISCFVYAIYNAEDKNNFRKFKKIILIVFFIIFPILTLFFLLISGCFLATNYVTFFSSIVKNTYIKPEGYVIASVIGIIGNLLIYILNCIIDNVIEKKWKKIAFFLNVCLILILFFFPVVGQKLALKNRIEYCARTEYVKCIIQEDSNVFIALKFNFEKNTIDLKNPVEFKFLNFDVKKGDIFYKTDNKYKKNNISYVEIYNDSTWGYIQESIVQ